MEHINGELTPEDVRRIKGCEGFSDQEANKLLDNLRTFVRICIEIYESEKKKKKVNGGILPH
jgi:hypothetical protein